jgi:hypothetical protein
MKFGSLTVNVAEWIGRRIIAIDKIRISDVK